MRTRLLLPFVAGLCGGMLPLLLGATTLYYGFDKPVDIVAGRDMPRPALNIRSHVGMDHGRRIAAVVIHNYTNGPGQQIDQVGGGPMLILKQANNPRQMPESKGNTSEAPFLLLTRAADGDVPAHVVSGFDEKGNLVYYPDAARQRVRTITARRADLALNVDKGKTIIFGVPPQVPGAPTTGAAENVLAVLPTGQLALWQNGKWRPLAFADSEAVAN